jgi:Helix-turn-helix of DDE superfamily endonuclease
MGSFMQKYDKINSLPSNRFRRLTGVSKSVFQTMLTVIRAAEQKRMEKGGKPSYLNTEDKLLMTLEYLREYRTYFHLGQSYGLSESACYRNCRWIEDVLIRDKAFSLPGKKVLLKDDTSIEMILVDATETPIERPKKTGTKQTKDQKQKQQTEAILFGQKEKAHTKKPGSCM